MHVYLPAVLTDLAAALSAGTVGSAPLSAYAVTPEVLAALPDGSDEELEYLAQQLAAEASLRLLAADPGAPRRRVIVVLDVDDAAVTDADGPEPGAVTLAAPVPAARIVSALVDEPAAQSAVTAVLTDPDDAAAIEDLEDQQLLWFAHQELADL